MTEQSLERIELEHTCTQLSIAYARHIDFREYDAFVELFAEDAHLNAGYPSMARSSATMTMMLGGDGAIGGGGAVLSAGDSGD